jgi:hypothetical protein
MPAEIPCVAGGAAEYDPPTGGNGSMHQQIRMVVPSGSPQDLAKPLRDLKHAGISLLAASGSNVEHGGEASFTVDHGDVNKAMQVLAPYGPRLVEVAVCWLNPDAPGELLRGVEAARHDAKWAGKRVRDISITTVRNDKGELGVQIYFDDPD